MIGAVKIVKILTVKLNIQVAEVAVVAVKKATKAKAKSIRSCDLDHDVHAYVRVHVI